MSACFAGAVGWLRPWREDSLRRHPQRAGRVLSHGDAPPACPCTRWPAPTVAEFESVPLSAPPAERLQPAHVRGFFGFWGGFGVRRSNRCFYGLSAELFKRVFEERGQSPSTSSTNRCRRIWSLPDRLYDVVVVMEYLECAEDPRHVLTFAARQLAGGFCDPHAGRRTNQN